MINQVKQGQSLRTNTRIIGEYTEGKTPELLKWELRDSNDVIWGSNNASLETLPVLLPNGKYQYTVYAEVHLSPDIPPTDNSISYAIYYELQVEGVSSFSVDDIEILPAVVERYGALNVLETPNNATLLQYYSPVPYANLTATIYKGNSVMNVVTPIEEVVSAGYLYKVTVDTSTYPIALEPYMIGWQGESEGQTYTEFSNLYLVQPTIWQAAKDVEAVIQRAYTVVAGQVDIIFTPEDLLNFLRLGRDKFNSIALPTEFTMTNALNAVRHLWITCSEILALRAQYLAEGMKAFNFSGQAVTLDADRTQYFENLASSLESSLPDDIRAVKQTMAKRGITGGDGSQSAVRSINIGSVGITLSPINRIANRRGSHNTYSNTVAVGTAFIRIVW